MIAVKNMISTVAILLLVAGSCAAQQPDGPWHRSLAEAQEVAAESGRTLLINFGGPGCGPCDRLREETLSDEAVATMIDEYFEAAPVNAAVQTELATRYLVNSFPTIIFMDADGTEVHRHRGFASAEGFLEVLAAGLQAHESLRHARALAVQAGDDIAPDIETEIAESFLAALQYGDAARWARRALENAPEDTTAPRAKASFVLGAALVEGDDPTAAIEHLQTALELDPDASWGWQARLKLGYALLQTDRRDDGAVLLREVAGTEEAAGELRDEATRLLRWAGFDAP